MTIRYCWEIKAYVLYQNSQLEFKKVYIETNPNFKMWFWDIVLDLFVRNKFVGCSLDVLVVRRYIPALVKSLYELGWFTKKDGYGKRRIQYSALEPFCRKLHI